MGKRGTKPKPTAIKERQGTLYKYRQRNEPKPELTIPTYPTWIDKNAKKYWETIAPELLENRLLTRLDQVALGLLCEALGEYCEARDIISAAATDKNGGGVKFVSLTEKGNLIQHPAVGVMNKAWAKVLKLLVQFGMTPSARAGLAIANAKEEPDLMSSLIAGSKATN